MSSGKGETYTIQRHGINLHFYIITRFNTWNSGNHSMKILCTNLIKYIFEPYMIYKYWLIEKKNKQ